MAVAWIMMGMEDEIDALGSCGGCRVFFGGINIAIFAAVHPYQFAVRTFGQVVCYNIYSKKNKKKAKEMSLWRSGIGIMMEILT